METIFKKNLKDTQNRKRKKTVKKRKSKKKKMASYSQQEMRDALKPIVPENQGCSNRIMSTRKKELIAFAKKYNLGIENMENKKSKQLCEEIAAKIGSSHVIGAPATKPPKSKEDAKKPKTNSADKGKKQRATPSATYKEQIVSWIKQDPSKNAILVMRQSDKRYPLLQIVGIPVVADGGDDIYGQGLGGLRLDAIGKNEQELKAGIDSIKYHLPSKKAGIDETTKKQENGYIFVGLTDVKLSDLAPLVSSFKDSGRDVVSYGTRFDNALSSSSSSSNVSSAPPARSEQPPQVPQKQRKQPPPSTPPSPQPRQQQYYQSSAPTWDEVAVMLNTLVDSGELDDDTNSQVVKTIKVLKSMESDPDDKLKIFKTIDVDIRKALLESWKTYNH